MALVTGACVYHVSRRLVSAASPGRTRPVGEKPSARASSRAAAAPKTSGETHLAAPISETHATHPGRPRHRQLRPPRRGIRSRRGAVRPCAGTPRSRCRPAWSAPAASSTATALTDALRALWSARQVHAPRGHPRHRERPACWCASWTWTGCRPPTSARRCATRCRTCCRSPVDEANLDYHLLEELELPGETGTPGGSPGSCWSPPRGTWSTAFVDAPAGPASALAGRPAAVRAGPRPRPDGRRRARAEPRRSSTSAPTS